MKAPRVILVLGLLGLGCGGAKVATSEGGARVVLPAATPKAREHFEAGVRSMNTPAGAEAAMAAFTAAVEEDPKLFEAWHDRGVVEARLGRNQAAAVSLARALEIQPGSRATLLALMNVLLKVRRADDAVATIERHLPRQDEVGGQADELRLAHVQALREAGKTSRALDEVGKLLARNSKSGQAFNALGLVYYRADRPALAETALLRAAELEPKNAEIWNNIGLVALARGRDREAFAAFDKAADLDGDFVEPRLNKAGVLLDCGDYRSALDELDRAVRARPDDPDVLVALGVARRGAGKPEDARLAYERALAVSPEWPAAHFNLGVLYMDFLPDKPKALHHLRTYRKVAPEGDARHKEAESRLKELR